MRLPSSGSLVPTEVYGRSGSACYETQMKLDREAIPKLLGISVAALAAWVLYKYLAEPLLFIVALVILGVFFKGTTEMARVRSPDRSLDAVLVRDDPGFVTGSPYYEVYIVNAGSNSHSPGNRVLEGNALESSRMAWTGPGTLEIDYQDSCINEFRNWWCNWFEHYGCASDLVEVRLIPPHDKVPHKCKSD